MPHLKWLCCIPGKRRKLSGKNSHLTQSASPSVLPPETSKVTTTVRLPDQRESPGISCETEVLLSPVLNESMPEIMPETQKENGPVETSTNLHLKSNSQNSVTPEKVPVSASEDRALEEPILKFAESEKDQAVLPCTKIQPVTVTGHCWQDDASMEMNKMDEKILWSDDLSPKYRRPRSLMAFTTSPLFAKKTRNDLLTPEILQDPEALAALGFGYPAGYGPPYPPLPLDIVLSLDSKHRRIVSPHDLEVHEACSTSCSVSSGFSSDERRCSVPDVSENIVGYEGSGDNSPASSYTNESVGRSEETTQKISDADLWWAVLNDPVEVPNAINVLKVGNDNLQEFGCHKSDLLCMLMLFAALEVPCDIDGLRSLPVIRSESSISNLADYLLARVVGGQTPTELIRSISHISEEAIYGRFFSTRPLPDVDLQRFLSFCIRKSVIPILCVNFEGLGVEQLRSIGAERDSTWQYRLVGSVLPKDGRTRILAPLCDVTAMQISHWLDTPETQLISRASLLYQLGYEGVERMPRRSETGNLTVLKHLDDELNVLGQVLYLMEIENSDNEMRFAQDVLSRHDGRARPGLEPKISEVLAPTRMENGILLFARQNNVEACDLIHNLNTPLRDLYTAP